MGDGSVCYCAAGAVAEVVHRLRCDQAIPNEQYKILATAHSMSMSTLNREAENYRGHGRTSIVYLNDSILTTHADVVNVFRRAIEKSKESEVVVA